MENISIVSIVFLTTHNFKEITLHFNRFHIAMPV